MRPTPGVKLASEEQRRSFIMAIHPDLASMAEEAVGEYLEIARRSIRARKPDGGCFGFPATLLLLAVIEAIGHFLEGAKVQVAGRTPVKITAGEPFRVLNHQIFGLSLSECQIKGLESDYRNRLAHNALLAPQRVLIMIEGTEANCPFVYGRDGALIGIELGALYRLVSRAWDHLERRKIADFTARAAAPRGAKLAPTTRQQ